MAEQSNLLAPASWQVTATTLSCGMVDDYVTIMVYRDWSCKCTWWERYKKAAAEDPRQKYPKGINQKMAKCKGPDCTYVIGYRDKLISEESTAGQATP